MRISQTTREKSSPKIRAPRQPKRIRASALFAAGDRQRVIELVQRRISDEVCLECGAKRSAGCGDFCEECRKEYPKVENVGETENGWQWKVIQSKPEYMGGAFEAVRDGVFDRRGRHFIAFADTRERAHELCERHRRRSTDASNRYWGF